MATAIITIAITVIITIRCCHFMFGGNIDSPTITQGPAKKMTANTFGSALTFIAAAKKRAITEVAINIDLIEN